MSDYERDEHGGASEPRDRRDSDGKSTNEESNEFLERTDRSGLSRPQKWSYINERFQRTERGEGRQKRFRLSPIIYEVIELIAEDLGIDENLVVEHAALAFYRNLLDPYREGFRNLQNSIELLLRTTDELTNEMAVSSAVATHVSASEIPTENKT